MYRVAILVVAFLLLGCQQGTESRLTLVVGFAAGGTSSIAARIIADSAGELGVTLLVENRPGAGGAIAAQYVLQQKGSGALLFMSSSSLLKVVPDQGLVPIGMVAAFPYVAVAKNDSPATLTEYMQAAKSDEKLRTVATPGSGSISHLIGAKMFKEHDVDMVHVPFHGASPAILSVLGGHVGLAIVPLPDLMPFKDSLRIVAGPGSGIEAGGWVAIFAPPDTSVREVNRLSEIFRKASELSKDKLEILGFRQTWRPGPHMRAIHRHEYELWMPVLESLGIQP